MAANVHELIARAAKVQRLVQVLDAQLVAVGKNPYAAEAATYVEQLSEKGWTAAGVMVALSPEAARKATAPSAETRTAVVAVYRARPEHVTAVRRATGLDTDHARKHVATACPNAPATKLYLAAKKMSALYEAEERADPRTVQPHGCNLHGGMDDLRAAIAAAEAGQ